MPRFPGLHALTLLALMLPAAMLRASPAAIAQKRAEMTQFPVDLGAGTYALGTQDSVVFLVTTSAGHVLVNSGFPEESMKASKPSLIRSQMAALGYDDTDVELLLSSHAHPDHVGGCAQVRRQTGALVAVMNLDADPVERGVLPLLGIEARFVAPCQVDQVLQDGDRIELGDVVLTAHRTAGHTKGATTWVVERAGLGRAGRLALLDSEMHYAARPMLASEYPGQLADFVDSIRTLRQLDVDRAYGPHGLILANREAIAAFLQERSQQLSEQAAIAVRLHSDPARLLESESSERSEYLDSLKSDETRLDYPDLAVTHVNLEPVPKRTCVLVAGRMQCK